MLGKQFRDDQFIWLMQWTYCEIRKTKEDTIRLNLVEARNLENLGAMGRLRLEGLLLFVHPNFILWWIILPLEGRRRGFSPNSSDSSSITRTGVIFVFSNSYSLPLIVVVL